MNRNCMIVGHWLDLFVVSMIEDFMSTLKTHIYDADADDIYDDYDDDDDDYDDENDDELCWIML